MSPWRATCGVRRTQPDNPEGRPIANGGQHRHGPGEILTVEWTEISPAKPIEELRSWAVRTGFTSYWCRPSAPTCAQMQAVCTCGCKTADGLHLRVQNCRLFAHTGAKLQAVCTRVCKTAGGLHLRVPNCRRFTPANAKLQAVCACGCKTVDRLQLRVHNWRLFALARAELQNICTRNSKNRRISTPTLIELQKVTLAPTDLQTVFLPHVQTCKHNTHTHTCSRLLQTVCYSTCRTSQCHLQFARHHRSLLHIFFRLALCTTFRNLQINTERISTVTYYCAYLGNVSRLISLINQLDGQNLIL